MKNKKGFTLIELLAVIIILAVIALIATPIVLNVVEKATKEANKNSVYGLLDGAKLYYAESLLDNEKSTNVNGTTNLINEIKISGKKPDNNSGEIYINSKGETALAVVYDDVCYKKDFDENNLTESDDVDNCKISNTTPQVTAYYEFGTPTTSSSTDYLDAMSYEGVDIVVKLEGEQLSACVYKDDALECFKNNNVSEESEHMQNVFDDCSTGGSYPTYCYEKESDESVYDTYVYSDGGVELCKWHSNTYTYCCVLNADDSVSCSFN